MTPLEMLAAVAGLMIVCATLNSISQHWSNVRIARYIGQHPEVVDLANAQAVELANAQIEAEKKASRDR